LFVLSKQKSMQEAKNKGKQIFFERLTPLQRIVISLVVAVAGSFIFPFDAGGYFSWLVLWDIFSVCYLICCWMVIFNLPVNKIKQRASGEDGSKAFVFAMVIISCIAAMVTVSLLVLKQTDEATKGWQLAVSIAGMLFSWAMVHTIYTFHYAHLFYNEKGSGGLEFPGSKNEAPDYMDFAYFAFVLGCTFQVSDVEISSKYIRRVALFHGLLSFALNTFVVALSINIMASLLPKNNTDKKDKTNITAPALPSVCHNRCGSRAPVHQCSI
jgi:uncharacterized membrane protein